MTGQAPAPAVHRSDGAPAPPPALARHWQRWLGATAAQLASLTAAGGAADAGRRLTVIGCPARERPGWDGELHPVTGVVAPGGAAVVSVPPALAVWARDLVAEGADLPTLRADLPARLGLPDHEVYQAVLRWAVDVPGAEVLAPVGSWLPVDDPRLPDWLRPFGGRALVALDEEGRYLAGVGLKRHDEDGQEIAVGTAEAARGRGLGRRLVAQAARDLLAGGVTPTYLHDPANLASARVADAAGLPDQGWHALGITRTDPTN